MVKVLSEELHRGLGSKRLQRRHVHVIDEDDTLLPHRRPIHPLPSFIQPRHDYILGRKKRFES